MIFRRTKQAAAVLSFIFFFAPIFWNSYALAGGYFDDVINSTNCSGGSCFLNPHYVQKFIDESPECKKCELQNKECKVMLNKSELGAEVDLVASFEHPSGLFRIYAGCVGSGQTKSEPSALENLQADLSARKPVLEINIPGLNFSDVASSTDKTGTYFYIAWIPELISALYKFLLAIVSIVAVVVIIIQGLRVITSAGGEAKTVAYKKILQSVIGLFIAWGSYAILYNINPALVQFNALKVKVVEPTALEELSKKMQDSTTPTTDESDYSVADARAPAFTNCPITLTNPFLGFNAQSKPRIKEFVEKIDSVITATTPAERILQVAEAASVCDIFFQNCGRTVGAIYTMAGLTSKKYPNKDCVLAKGGCETHTGFEAKAVPRDLFKLLRDDPKYNCEKEGYTTACRKPFTDIYRQDYRLIQEGWPDRIALTLQPGDAFWVYSGAPTHAAIFVRWSTKKGYAEVIQGGPEKKVSAGTLCILKECNDNKFRPLLIIFKPK